MAPNYTLPLAPAGANFNMIRQTTQILQFGISLSSHMQRGAKIDQTNTSNLWSLVMVSDHSPLTTYPARFVARDQKIKDNRPINGLYPCTINIILFQLILKEYNRARMIYGSYPSHARAAFRASNLICANLKYGTTYRQSNHKRLTDAVLSSVP